MLEWRAFGFAVKDGASDFTHGMGVREEADPDYNRMIDITPDDQPTADPPEPPDIPEEIPVEPVVDVEAFLDVFESAVIAASNQKELQEVWDADEKQIEGNPELLERAQALYDAKFDELAEEREAMEAAE